MGEFNSLIAQMYRAVDHDEAFSEISDSLRDMAGIVKGVIAVRDASSLEMIESHQWGIDEKSYAEYENYYYKRDIFTKGVARRPMGRFHAIHQFLENREYLNSEVYDGFGRLNGIRHVASSIVPIEHSHNIGQFVCIREPGGKKFERDTLDSLDILVPHFQQFIFLRNKIRTYKKQIQTLDHVLSKWSSSVFVCQENLKVIYTNDQAQEMASKSKDICLVKGYLSLTRYPENKRLQNMVHCACAAAKGETQITGGSMRLNGENESFEIMVIPLHYATNSAVPDSGQPTALALIKPAHQALTLPVEIRELFDLTPSEGDVLQGLCRGMTPREIADARETSLETVRAQVRSVYQKTKSSNQAQLLSRVLGGVSQFF